MKISILGTGYVGLVTGLGIAKMTAFNLTFIDTEEEKIKRLQEGNVPFYEPQLKEHLNQFLNDSRVTFTTNMEAIKDSDVIFITVGTPSSEDGSVNLAYILECAKQIGRHIEKDSVIVMKSTVPPGTTKKVKDLLSCILQERGKNKLTFHMVSNPEFLREGSAFHDFYNPFRIIIGTDSKKAKKVMEDIYHYVHQKGKPIVWTNIQSAEVTKYTSNAMLATRISFMNEMAYICELAGASIDDVKKGMGYDPRIGPSFLNAGIGYGGSCFPKDIKGLIRYAEEKGYAPAILQSVEEVNQLQRKKFIKKIIERFGTDLSRNTFCVWGLSFKPGTDDMREAPAIFVIHELLKRGATIHAHDPVAIPTAKKMLYSSGSSLLFKEDPFEAAENTDALILLTEWEEYRDVNIDKLLITLRKPVIFDGRNLFQSEMMRQKRVEYYSIGR